MSTFQQQYSAYTSSHQTSKNNLLHLIGVPLMIIGFLMLTNWVSLNFAAKFQISFAWIFVLAAIVYYFMFDVKLAAVSALFYIILALIVTWIAGPTPDFSKFAVAIILLAGGFAAQYFGHSLEKSPAPTKNNFKMMLLMPLFFVFDLVKLAGFKSVIMSK